MSLRGATRVILALASVAGACADTARAPVESPEPETPDASTRDPAPSAPRAGFEVQDASVWDAIEPATLELDAAPVDPKKYVKSEANARLPNGKTLAGPCVDPRAHAAFVLMGLSPDIEASTQVQDSPLAIDLDGDGTRELVMDGGAARWQRTYHLYLRRGACGHYVGSIAASETPTKLAARTNGLAEIETFDDECPLLVDGGLGGGYCQTTWRFDGKSYARAVEKPTTRRPKGIQP